MTIEGIRFLFTSFVPNFQNFGVIAVTFIAMMGAGLAESAGLMGALIRKLVAVAPRGLIAFSDHSVGGLSSVASDAGYLILIPLAPPRSRAWTAIRSLGWPRASPGSRRRSRSTSSSSRSTRCSAR